MTILLRPPVYKTAESQITLYLRRLRDAEDSAVWPAGNSSTSSDELVTGATDQETDSNILHPGQEHVNTDAFTPETTTESEEN